MTTTNEPHEPAPPPGLFEHFDEPTDGDVPPESPSGVKPRLRRVEDGEDHWEHRLTRTATTGAFRKNTANAITIFANHPAWEGVLAYDEFGTTVVKRKPPPWDADDAHKSETGDMTDDDTIRAQAWLARRYGIDIGLGEVGNALTIVSQRRAFHPVRDYLRGLEWDGAERLSTWLSTLLGAKDTAYVRAVARAFLISAVARVMRPGCKVDTMLVLEGAQGKGKSTALRLLASDEWFVELAGEIDPRETPQQLRRKWLAEFPELSAFKRTRDVEVIKGWLSRLVDNYRPPYARSARDFPRQIVHAGSTNEERYLVDPTGARRFLPVLCGTINLRGIEIERDQLWAEAFKAYEAGEVWHFTEESVLAESKVEQDERYEEDVWTDLVRDWVTPRAAVGVTTTEILADCMKLDRSLWTQHASSRVGTIVRRMGWLPRGKERPRRYYAPPAATGATVVPPDASAQGGTPKVPS